MRIRAVAVAGVAVLLLALFPAAPASAAPPSAPAGVSVRVVKDRVVLSWRHAADADGFVRTYEIERDGVWVGWTWGDVTSWVDPDADPAGGHVWTVRAVDDDRGWSDRSEPVRVRIRNRPPTKPTRLTAEVSAGEVRLSWRPARDRGRVVRYEIERDGAWVGSTDGATTTWTEPAASLAGAHRWRVYAVDRADRAGRRSRAARLTLPGTPEQPPPPPPQQPPPPPPPPPAPPVTLLAAGDIGQCGGGQAAVADLIAARPGVLFAALGDIAYGEGTAAQFRDCYDPWFGAFRSRTRPIPGNHEYRTPGASPYFDYFGALAGNRGEGWYAYDLGSWRIYALNSECWEVGGCGTADPQYRWLQADLAANPRPCIAAYWHRPLRTTDVGGRDETPMIPVYDLLDASGADIVLNGHAHVYERWDRMDSAGRVTTSGIRNFAVGTGGVDLREFGPWRTGLQARGAAHGVLELTLRHDGYDWSFVPVAGASYTDRGSDSC